MTDESVIQQPVMPTATEPQRGKSTIDFPYLDLENAIEIVKAIHRVEGDRCEWNQLATAIGVAPDGGGFRMRMLTAKTFGLLTYEKGQVMLTENGIRATDQNYEKRARFEAFMSVPLFKQLFDRFNGQPMPPVAAVDRAIESLGVAPKQKEKARQVFQRSAKQGGLYELSMDRISMPPGLNQSQPKPQTDQDFEGKDKRRERSGQDRGLHPFIEGLIGKLPEPDSEWDMSARAKWLLTAANIFDLMYKAALTDAGVTVKLEGSTLSILAGGTK